MLVFRWSASNGMTGSDVFAPVRWKHLDLRPPKVRLSAEVRGNARVARLSAEALALFVTLEADRPGRFSTNAIELVPGEDAEITFTPADGDPAGVTLAVRDLHSSFSTT